MRILDPQDDKPLSAITIYLTIREASELRDKLTGLLDERTGHEHVPSEDFQKEITVCVYDVTSLNHFDSRSKKLILEDS